MTSEEQHEWARKAQAELRGLLNAWDPYGLVEGPDDEYDSVRDKLLSRLLRGDDDIAGFLRAHAAHQKSDNDVDAFAGRVMDWWRDRESRK